MMIKTQNSLLTYSSAFFILLWFLILFPKFFWVFTFIIVFTAAFIANHFIEVKLQERQSFYYLVLPIFYALGLCTFIVSSGRFLQILSIIGGSLLFYLLVQALVIFKNSRSVVAQGVKNLLTSGSILTVFFMSVFTIGLSLHYKFPFFISLILLGISTVILSSFLFWHHHISSSRSIIFSLTLGFLAAEIAYIMRFWNITYPFYNLKITTGIWGVPLIALLVLIIYYFFWGISFHYLEEDLNRKHIIEYLLITAVTLGFILSTAKWVIG